ALSREEFEEPNIHTAQGLLLAGGVESDRGDSAGGERLLREALELHEQLYGESSPQVAAVLLSLGAVHEETNRWREALGIYRRAREIWLAQPGENARSLATSSHSLAVVHWRLGEYEEATGLLRGAIAALEALGDEASGSLLGSRNTLADVLSEAGRLEEAEALLEATLDSALRVFGPSHSRTGTAYNSLGNLRVRIGSWRAARESYRSAQKAYEAAGGADHPWVAYPVDNLGLLDSAEGRYRDAEGQHRRALEIREAHTAALDLATSWLGLARALNAQGDRPGEVESALGEARALLDAAGQEAQEIEASISLQTGLLRYARGDLEGAAAQIERASAADGFLHARFEARIALAEIARARQRPEQALRHEAEAQKIVDNLPLEVSEGWAERFRASLRP
ncbi:MAG: tetratricopeptide repeat protein, partial [Acidobacteriota bacterium]